MRRMFRRGRDHDRTRASHGISASATANDLPVGRKRVGSLQASSQRITCRVSEVVIKRARAEPARQMMKAISEERRSYENLHMKGRCEMKRRIINLRSLRAIALATSLIVFPVSAMAQRGPSIKTDTKIIYHGGPVMTGSTDVYLIWYGNWAAIPPGTQSIVTEFISFLGSSPYFQINTAYTDSVGAAPNGALLYAGSVNDFYSYGPSLTVPDLQDVIRQNVSAGNLPLDTTGIYLALATPDVTDIRPDGSQYCTPPGTLPHHGTATVSGVPLRYAFIGHPNRCPTSVGSQFNGGALPTPNDNFAADVMVSTIAHVLNALVTNPAGNGWFDRYGLDIAAKCFNNFGETYTTSNGARANVRLGGRDYLLQQNWVNARKGYCGLSIQ